MSGLPRRGTERPGTTRSSDGKMTGSFPPWTRAAATFKTAALNISLRTEQGKGRLANLPSSMVAEPRSRVDSSTSAETRPLDQPIQEIAWMPIFAAMSMRFTQPAPREKTNLGRISIGQVTLCATWLSPPRNSCATFDFERSTRSSRYVSGHVKRCPSRLKSTTNSAPVRTTYEREFDN